MKFALLYVAGAREPYAEAAEQNLITKINPLMPMASQALKAKSADRADAEFKRHAESKRILAALEPTDLVWLFDERGQLAKSSEEFSKWLAQGIESAKQRMVFVIGGPFGVAEELRRRADRLVSLSPLVMNHHVAKIVALEQIYRGLAIWRRLPYHNA